MMDDSILLMDMVSAKVSRRLRSMCTSLKDKTQNAFIVDVLDYLINCNEGVLKHIRQQL